MNELDKFKLIRRRLSEAYSNILVYGMGCDSKIIPTYRESEKVRQLLSWNNMNVNDAWKDLHSITEYHGPDKNSFINRLISMYAEHDCEYKKGTLYILKTSIADTLISPQSQRFKLLELNGNLYKGANIKTGEITTVHNNAEITEVQSLFPTDNYSNKKKSVEQFERLYKSDYISSIVILGSSGNCPVTESLFNLALVNKAKIIVVNNDPDCYMHDLADVSIKMDVQEFFDKMDKYYLEDCHSYGK